MKIVKLKASDFKKDIIQLLKRVGATSQFRAFPDHVYLSKNDYKAFEKLTAELFKREYPFLRDAKIQASVGMHMLNYGPSTVLQEAIKDGYALVDEVGIAEEIGDQEGTKGAV